MKTSEVMTCRKMNGSGILYVIKLRKACITFSVMQNLHTHSLPPPLKKKMGGTVRGKEERREKQERIIEYMCGESRN